MKSRRKGEAQQMKLIAIAVVASNGVIGDGNDQPFKFAEDWARFKKITMGHSMIMGRKTHDAMGLLPGEPVSSSPTIPRSSASRCPRMGVHGASR